MLAFFAQPSIGSMAARSKITKLPAAVKAWLDNNLVENSFGQYEALSAHLRTLGFDIGKSSLHRYGQVFEQRLAAVKMATEQARAVAEAAPDDDNVMSDGLIRLVQQKAFDMLVNMDDSGKQASFGTLAKIASELGHSSVAVKDFRQKTKQKTKEVANEIAETIKAAGLSNEAIKQIRAKILGIAEA